MGTVNFSCTLLFILNVIHVLFALGVAAAGIWFFVEIQSIVGLRDPDIHRLDFQIHWPQAIPWFFVIAGFFVIVVSCCAFAGAKSKNRGILKVYVMFEVISILCLIAAASMSFMFASSNDTENFIKTTIYDGFTHMQVNPNIKEDFGNIERKFQCCGAANAGEYRKWQSTLPLSCCDSYYRTGDRLRTCDFSDHIPNNRHGCSEVVIKYASIAMKAVAVGAAVTALIGLIKLFATWALSSNSKKNSRSTVTLAAQNELESKKVLL